MTDASGDVFSPVALFPLPSVVLFPCAILPLHIFEERYRDMTADALAGDRRIAMALLRPGWEKSYYGRPAIEPVVCVGEIVSHERLEDGKYNFLLRGVVRARIVRELPASKPYRIAEIAPIEQVPAMEIDLEDHRRRMRELFGETALGKTPAGRQFARIVRSDLPTALVADVAAFTFVDDVWTKQSLLAEADVRRRVQRTLELLCRTSELLSATQSTARARVDPSVN